MRIGTRVRTSQERGGLLRTLAAAVCLSVAVTGVAVTGRAAPASAAGHDHPTIIPVDLLQAGTSVGAAREAIAIWNRAVPSIRFTEQDSPSTLSVLEIESEEGWQSRVDPDGLGMGRVYVDTKDAALIGAVRVLVHEFGHMLSLPDLGRTDCTKVMALPDPACTNVQPDADERAAVAAFVADHELGDTMPGWELPGED